MNGSYRAAFLVGPEKIVLGTLPVPELAAREVLIKIHHANLCPTDLKKYYQLDERSREILDVNHPIVLGHEAAGIVLEVGSAVKTVKSGDRVALDPMLPCGRCVHCEAGDLPMCQNLSAIGASAGTVSNAVDILENNGVGGCFAEIVKVPEKNLFFVPDTLNLAAASLMEPLADVLHSIEAGDPQAGETAVVFGLGAMGLMHIRVLSHLKVKEIIGIDPIPERRKLAEGFGASVTLDPFQVDVVSTLKAYNKGIGPELIYVCTGGEAQKTTADQALRTVQKGGRILLYASAAKPSSIPVDINHLHYGMITLTGTVGFYHRHGELALEYLDQGVVDAGQIRRPVFPLEDIEKAFHEYGKSDVVKVGIDLESK